MNNKIKAVLFDLDGTLLPMADQGVFAKRYFGEIARVVSACGFLTPEKLVEYIWSGTKCMRKNDGSGSNMEIFWKNFSDCTGLNGEKLETVRGMCDGFYSKEFHNIRETCGFEPLAARAVELAGKDGRKVVLASNPVFPQVGQKTRMQWAGVDRFDFALITSYENQKFCKPDPRYYLDVCHEIGVEPQECLMIGNDELEDAKGASEAGMNCFLLTDYLIPCENWHWDGMRGNFEQLIEFLSSL